MERITKNKKWLTLILSILMLVSVITGISVSRGIMTANAGSSLAIKTVMLGQLGIYGPQKQGTGSNTYKEPESYVYFGKYGSTNIKWRVLNAGMANDGKTKGMFLLSEDLLMQDIVFDSGSSNVYKNNSVRSMLTSFAGNTENFSTAEQNAMLAISKTDTAGDVYLKDNSSLASYTWGASELDGDKVFLLSAQELYDYVATYNGAPGLKVSGDETNNEKWWLRSPSTAADNACAGWVLEGKVDLAVLSGNKASIRPGMNLNPNSILFTSAAYGGKSADGMDNGLANVSYYSGNEWKLTLLDSNRALSISETEATGEVGGNFTLHFSGATLGTAGNDYISAIIEDSDGNVNNNKHPLLFLG